MVSKTNMNALINRALDVYKKTGFKELLRRLYLYFIFKCKRLFYGYDKENIRRFHELKGKYKGKRIFILGNGPSLNQMPLYLLKDEYKMCFNRFFLMVERLNWKPDFFATTDSSIIKDMAEELNEIAIPQVKYAFFPDLHPTNTNYMKYIKQKDNVYWLYVDKPGFSDNLPFCGINTSVVNAGIQVAAYLGFSEIYIIGVDMTFLDMKVKKINSYEWVSDQDDKNHFDPRYFSKGRAYHNPSLNTLESFDECKAFYADKDVKLYNAGYGGRLEAFPRVKFEEVLNIPPDKQKTIFMEAIHSIKPGVSLDDFPLKKGGDKEFNFRVDAKDGAGMVKDFILTHVPFGPYEGMYYFLKRNENLLI